MVPIESQWVLHISAPGESNLKSVTIFEIFRVKILTFDPSGSSKVKYDVAKRGAGLQQAPLCHPAKIQPDFANGLRDVHYQIFIPPYVV